MSEHKLIIKRGEWRLKSISYDIHKRRYDEAFLMSNQDLWYDFNEGLPEGYWIQDCDITLTLKTKAKDE